MHAPCETMTAMWTKTAPVEPGYYWVKLKGGWQEPVLGDRDPLSRKRLIFYYFSQDVGHSGESLIRDGIRFWSEPIPSPEKQPHEWLDT